MEMDQGSRDQKEGKWVGLLEVGKSAVDAFLLEVAHSLDRVWVWVLGNSLMTLAKAWYTFRGSYLSETQ